MQDIPDLPRGLTAYFAKTGVALSLAQVEADDVPLVLVNDGFTRLTGYEQDDVVGQNCRFLQGPETGEADKAALHDFIHDPAAESGRFPVLNYRKDGTAFHNFVYMTRLRDARRSTRFILASQFDMTSAQRQAMLRRNDASLGRSLDDIEAIGRGFGLAMMGSAEMLAKSVATIAQLSLDTDLA